MAKNGIQFIEARLEKGKRRRKRRKEAAANNKRQ